MVDENGHRSKQLKLIVGLVVLLLFILLSSGILFVARIADGKELTHHASAGTTTATAPRATPTPSLTPQPLFFDNFLDNKHGWYTSDVSGYTRLIDNNVLTLSDTNHRVLTESLPTSTTFDDFSITATFTLLEADVHDSVGLYLRGDSNLDHDYRVDVFGDSSYALSKESLDVDHNPVITYLISPTRTSALKPLGQQNTLTVIMKGSDLTLLINNTMVNSLVDTDYTRGQIALFVNNSAVSHGVTAIFSSIVVYPVPDQLPS
jgi:hypothetical protein